MAINMAISDGSIYTKPKLLETFARTKNGNGRMHFLGLVRKELI